MRSKVIMVYPQMGFSGALVLHAPIGLLYASIELVKNGIDVRVLDTRLYRSAWRERLKEMLDKDVLAVGISVMSGPPIKSAADIGRFVKSIDPEIKVVWGGPHATFFPQTILSQGWHCDYVVSGYAIKSFHELIKALMDSREPDDIEGISYRGPKGIVRTPPDVTKFEFCDYRDIPYGLIKDYSYYGQLDQAKRIFSIYGALGCPYKCSFCCSPAQYSKIKDKKWVALPASKVVDHIEYLVKDYGANYIYFIDDDSFVDIRHVEEILDEIARRRISVKIGFRGARINEIRKMDDAYIDKLAAMGTDILHVGAESGSDRILGLLHKDCTVQDIIECNLKLAKHPSIIAAYNFIIGLPTETIEDIRATRDLMQRLVSDNPRCLIFQPNKYQPIPGTELFNLVQKRWDYKAPVTAEEWAKLELENDFSMPWYEKDIKKFYDLLLIWTYFVDNKVGKVTSGGTLFYKILGVINSLYGPVIRWRMRHEAYGFFIEHDVYKLATKVIKNVVPRKTASPSCAVKKGG